MNKLPAKQIYILIVAIVGVIAASVYSTYAIFTLESETANIVSIKTPKNVELTTESYEYKQVIVPKNSYINVDIDLYNNTDDNLCYGVWYKIVTNDLVKENKVKIYENTNTSLTTSGVIDRITSKRVHLLIINDNDNNAKINIGMNYEKNSDSCHLNLAGNRKLVSSTIDSPKVLSEELIKNINHTNDQEGYLVYKDNKEQITISKEKILISSEFTYKEENFTLNNPEEISINNLNDYQSNENTSYYTCLESNKCRNLYKITSITNGEEVSIDKYDILFGYLNGESGLRKVNNDYLYYGDNPHNFIYYNCKNELDTNSCELWRIIGFYYNDQTQKYLPRIIRNSAIGKYNYSEVNNLFNNSTIWNYLNKEYKIYNDNLLTEMTYEQENVVTSEDSSIVSYLNEKYKANVTLMKLTDYLNASICQKENILDYDSTCLNKNWLNNYIDEYTMTIKYEMPTTDPETEEEIIPDNNIVYSVGNNIKERITTEKLSIRPVIYLKERALLISGDGTINNPYVIK